MLGFPWVPTGAEGLGQVRIQRQADLAAIHCHQPPYHPACPRDLVGDGIHHLALPFDLGFKRGLLVTKTIFYVLNSRGGSKASVSLQ